MSCEICGRGNCTRLFHSLEEQYSFDEIADNVKDTLRTQITRSVDRLPYLEIDGDVYVKLDDVCKAIDE